MDGAPAWKAVAKLVWINGGIADMQYAVGKSWIFWYGIFSAITQSASKYWMSVSARLDKRCQELKWSLWRGRCGSRPLQCFHGINYGFYFYKKILTHDKDTFLTIRPRPRRLLIRKAFSKQAIVPKSLVTATYFTAAQTLTVLKSSDMISHNDKFWHHGQYSTFGALLCMQGKLKAPSFPCPTSQKPLFSPSRMKNIKSAPQLFSKLIENSDRGNQT